MFGSNSGRRGLFFRADPRSLDESPRQTAGRALCFLVGRLHALYRCRRLSRRSYVDLLGAAGHVGWGLEALSWQARTSFRLQELIRFRRN
jgi:hypothetical protein